MPQPQCPRTRIYPDRERIDKALSEARLQIEFMYEVAKDVEAFAHVTSWLEYLYRLCNDVEEYIHKYESGERELEETFELIDADIFDQFIDQTNTGIYLFHRIRLPESEFIDKLIEDLDSKFGDWEDVLKGKLEMVILAVRAATRKGKHN
ncbi:MAG: hypothetical protein JRJ38_07460 [Deltaproteobacteria bacterium]|nr:hypothetical protein [Deltaproteobacteria bacterium]